MVIILQFGFHWELGISSAWICIDPSLGFKNMGNLCIHCILTHDEAQFNHFWCWCFPAACSDFLLVQWYNLGRDLEFSVDVLQIWAIWNEETRWFSRGTEGQRGCYGENYLQCISYIINDWTTALMLSNGVV